MAATHMPHAALAHHGIHLVPRSAKTAKPPLISSATAFKIAAAGAALVLAMTVC